MGHRPPEQLPSRVRQILSAGEVTASVVSYWELVLKKDRKTALVLEPKAWWERYITRLSVQVLPVRVAHIDKLDVLPEWHRDPLDRILVAQALAENCTLVSRDAVLGQDGAPLLWE